MKRIKKLKTLAKLGKYVAMEGAGEPTRWGFYDEEEERLSGW